MIIHMDTRELDKLRNELGAQIHRAKAAEAQLERIREALGGYPDSDLVSLAETIRRGHDAWVSALEARAGDGDGGQPLPGCSVELLYRG